MATNDQESKERARLKAAIQEITSISPESLKRPELGVDLNFESGFEYFKRTLDLFSRLKNFNLDAVPSSILRDIASHTEDALKDFKQIHDFSLQKYPSNSIQQRDQFVSRVRDAYDEHFRFLIPYLSFFERQDFSLDEIASQARGVAADLTELSNTTKDELDKKLGEAVSTLEAIRRAAAESGVSRHAIYFKDEAALHELSAARWLKAIIALSSLTLSLAAILVLWPGLLPSDLSSAKSIQLVVAKIILFSTLFFSIAFASKTYRAARHNAVLNKHRQNALSTFQAFVKGTDDETTKNAVLLRSTETIFSPSITGFTSGEADSPGYPQILEIFKTVADKSK
ncbi:MAG: hypothetical protein H6508_00395 [Calditrichaeota bacterium]|nr:hypothetical protein [Calditrichota bacterium]MCB9365632.1 hypothetical protein [Calditrichota bacterium]